MTNQSTDLPLGTRVELRASGKAPFTVYDRQEGAYFGTWYTFVSDCGKRRSAGYRNVVRYVLAVPVDEC